MERFAPFLWLLIPVGSVAFWCFVCWIIAFFGWRRLLAFRTEEKPQAQFFLMQSAYIGAGDYKGCLTIGLAAAGIYLAIFPLFAVGHPPLLIPWSAIERTQNRRVWLFTSFVVTVRVAQFKTVEIALYHRALIDAIKLRVSDSG